MSSYLACEMLISNVWNSALPLFSLSRKNARLAFDNFFTISGFNGSMGAYGARRVMEGASFVYLFAGLGIRMAIPIMYTSWDRKKFPKNVHDGILLRETLPRTLVDVGPEAERRA